MYIGLHEKKSGNQSQMLYTTGKRTCGLQEFHLFSDETIKQIQTISKTFQVQECICSIIT